MKQTIFTALLILFISVLHPYPIDGYKHTGIRRLVRLQKILNGEIQDKMPVKGQLKKYDEIKLNLLNPKGDSLQNLPAVDPVLQKKISALFPNLHESYSLVVLDITPGRKAALAEYNPDRTYQPGSIGKLAIIAGLFTELQKIFPDDFSKRINLLKTRMVKGGKWVVRNFHTIPTYDIETGDFHKAVAKEDDLFSLYEWADHMLSVSSNAAASVVWKEMVLMRAFGKKYPPSAGEEEKYFKDTPKQELREITVSVVNDPLIKMGITEDEWHLGSLFTSEGKKRLPGSGGSKASPKALIKYLVKLESGKIVDRESSLEIKRLMYMTDRRIRYAASPSLREAAVYFKSGSIYKCRPEPDYECRKYKGNEENYMNSVAIVEQPDGSVYFVALMSNVLKKNSDSDHRELATSIDKIIRRK